MDHKAAVLIAEDLDTDVLLYKRVFRLAQIPNPVRFVSNGEEFIHYLLGYGPYSDRSQYPWPGLILLDLKMHKVNGLEALAWMRDNPACQNIPVLVVSSSLLPRDEDLAIGSGAQGYFAKTIGFAGLLETIRAKTGLCWESPATVQARG